MIQLTVEINKPVQITLVPPFGSDDPSGQDSLILLKDGAVVTSPEVNVEKVGLLDLYTFTFLPQATGTYQLFVYNELQAYVEVVTKSLHTYLQNIEDEALGSWRWDKVEGTLAMLRQDGTELATFAVVDTMTEASRERTS